MIITQCAQYPNLQELVILNRNDIDEIKLKYQTLADYGIHIQGVVRTEQDIPVEEYQYGDAWLVGVEDPYDIWIYTRGANEGLDDFVNMGPLAVVGPEGPKGEKGDRGDTGPRTNIFLQESTPGGGVYGDLWIKPNGNLYKFTSDNLPLYQGSLRGPQGVQGIQGPAGPKGDTGAQGPKGDTGDVGGFVNIRAILASSSELPSPTLIHDLTAAYLVGASSPYDLYIQVGETSATAVWTDTGPFNAATLVTVNGDGQNVWDADTKLDKSSAHSVVYINNYDGEQDAISFSNEALGGTIAYRGASGVLAVGTPSANDDAVNKGYADEHYVKKIESTSGLYVYTNDNGVDGKTAYSATVSNNSIVRRDANGCVKTATPQSNTDAVNIQYGENHYQQKKAWSSTFTLNHSSRTGVIVDSAISLNKMYEAQILVDYETVSEGDSYKSAGMVIKKFMTLNNHPTAGYPVECYPLLTKTEVEQCTHFSNGQGINIEFNGTNYLLKVYNNSSIIGYTFTVRFREVS